MLYNRVRVLGTVGLIAIFALGATGCKKLEARSNMNKGVQAYKAGEFELAASLFKSAAELDPSLTVAETYLATAYYQQYIKNDTDKAPADKAIETFESILKRDPSNIDAIDGVAGVYQRLKRYDKSREYYLKHTQLDPKNAPAFYAVASLDWYIAGDPGQTHNESVDRPDISGQTELIDEGLQFADKAIALDPDYADAMKFKSLLLLEKVRLAEAGSEESVQFSNESKKWSDNANAARQRKEEKNRSVGITLEPE